MFVRGQRDKDRLGAPVAQGADLEWTSKVLKLIYVVYELHIMDLLGQIALSSAASAPRKMSQENVLVYHLFVAQYFFLHHGVCWLL